MQHLGDEELIARYRSGRGLPHNDVWLNELFNRYAGRIAAWCCRHTGDRELASDLAQEIMLRVFEKIDSFEGGARFSTWLYTVARNHCINAMKSRTARGEDRLEPIAFDPLDESAQGVEEELMQQGRVEEMKRLMQDFLDDTERRVLVLHYADGLSLETVTRLLSLDNASGAKAFIVSARRKLQRALLPGGKTSKGGEG